MTAKSRRHKFDKRKKSDERSHPRRTEAEARREASNREDKLVEQLLESKYGAAYVDKREASKRDHPASGRKDVEGRSDEVRILHEGRLVEASFVAEGKGLGTFEFTDISPEAFDLITGEHAPFIARGLGDHGELTPEGFAKQRAVEAGLQEAGSSDS